MFLVLSCSLLELSEQTFEAIDLQSFHCRINFNRFNINLLNFRIFYSL